MISGLQPCPDKPRDEGADALAAIRMMSSETASRSAPECKCVQSCEHGGSMHGRTSPRAGTISVWTSTWQTGASIGAGDSLPSASRTASPRASRINRIIRAATIIHLTAESALVYARGG